MQAEGRYIHEILCVCRLSPECHVSYLLSSKEYGDKNSMFMGSTTVATRLISYDVTKRAKNQGDEIFLQSSDEVSTFSLLIKKIPKAHILQLNLVLLCILAITCFL